MERTLLSETQVEQYRQEGYLVVPDLFNAGDITVVNNTIEDITADALAAGDYDDVLELEPESSGDQPALRRLNNPFDHHESFRNVATDDRLLDSIESLIGPNFVLHHSKLNAKPARVGSVVEWHQDLSYFPHTNDSLVTTLIYLDDATEENGCLQVLPRHHTHYFNHLLPDGEFAGMITEEIGDGRYGRTVPLEAKAGSAILMHCLTPHCSPPNGSAKNRRTLIFEYCAADAFPIYHPEATVKGKKAAHLLRGKRSNVARFGGPPPLVPRPSPAKSIYERQSRAKAATKTG
jgi:ectoine hydroxylase-related dioxygenase (phytanoyl-CoA dioxygenase family)